MFYNINYFGKKLCVLIYKNVNIYILYYKKYNYINKILYDYLWN